MARRKQLWEDVPMPGMDKLVAVHDQSEIHGLKRPTIVASGWCPGCRKTPVENDRGIGVIEQGGHLVWKLHNRKNIYGTAMQCPTSGVMLCVSRPLIRQIMAKHVAACICGD